MRFPHWVAFLMYLCWFNYVDRNECNYYENATQCGKRMRKRDVTTWLLSSSKSVMWLNICGGLVCRGFVYKMNTNWLKAFAIHSEKLIVIVVVVDVVVSVVDNFVDAEVIDVVDVVVNVVACMGIRACFCSPRSRIPSDVRTSKCHYHSCLILSMLNPKTSQSSKWITNQFKATNLHPSVNPIIWISS